MCTYNAVLGVSSHILFLRKNKRILTQNARFLQVTSKYLKMVGILIKDKVFLRRPVVFRDKHIQIMSQEEGIKFWIFNENFKKISVGFDIKTESHFHCIRTPN